ncbi:Panacea domain-containing protein [Leisingera sp.]|uniref:Panacea domain-containing protein n=1 Tax=Leisingera sp. TaxID=1879318 RepID=UPI002B273292|nr:type II toxin-antitoxin system antitoxin SocA domain-containing protein [Leisingera sp.]
MAYSAASIANAFLNHAFAEGKSISPMKAQKLVYIAHGYALVECREPILDEVFEAWKFGPVLNTLYHECKYFGKDGIPRLLDDFDHDTGTVKKAPIPTDPKVAELIDFVWQTYGEERAADLSDWTHEKGGPWDQVTDGGRKILRHQEVPNDLIRDYFFRTMYTV